MSTTDSTATPARQQRTHYDLTGRVAVIPGGLGGLGQAVTQEFIEAGAVVVAVGSSEHAETITRLRARLGEGSERFFFERADAGDEAQVEAMTWSVVERHHRLDVLVNLVGGWQAGQPVSSLELATWRDMLDQNLNTAFLLSKYAARPMIQQQWGAILHVSSRGALSGRRNAAAYAVAKNAMLTLMEVQSEELRGENVTVNAILPSIIDTPANRANMPTADFSRWLKAEDVARVLLFLASDDARLISGASIPVYGQA